MRRGSLADAMRATMSLPLDLSPGRNERTGADRRRHHEQRAGRHRESDGRGSCGGRQRRRSHRSQGSAATRCSAWRETLDAMMRASTRRALTSADVVINVPLDEYGSLDWRRRRADRRGLPCGRGNARPIAAARRERSGVRGVASQPPGAPADRVPPPAFIEHRRLRPRAMRAFEGAARSARRHAAGHRRRRGGHRRVAGLDRYETVTWRMIRDAARGVGLRVQGRPSVCAAFPDAGHEPREHDVERLPHHSDRTLSCLRRRRIGLGAAHRRHHRFRSGWQ